MEKNSVNLDTKIVFALEKLMQVQRILLWDVSRKEKLSPLQIQFLIYLKTYADEFRKVSNLAIEFDLTKATVSDAISSLSNGGYLLKIRETDDKRSYILKLTEKGKRVVKRIEKWKDPLVKQIAEFSNIEKERIMLFLMKLIKSLFDEGVINIARLCIACENYQTGSKSGRITKHYCRIRDEEFFDYELDIGCQFYKNSKDVGG